MMAAGGTQRSLRMYLGALKDSTTVGLAKVNSDYKDLDIAIVRATNHAERPAKEKHIKSIFLAVSAVRPRSDVAYCIHAIGRRLSKTHNWAVALKTLIVIHRALREVDPTFREELISYGRSRSLMLNLSHFKDDSSAKAWDYSAWVRTYALYLEERLECFHVLKYDVETDLVRIRDLETAELLVQLPVLQQLLFRLINCQPHGAAVFNYVIHLALSMVADESKKIYNAISDGTINMVDKFFEMQRHDAVKALDIYQRAGQQAERLSEFYDVCKSIAVGHGGTFSRIEQPSASFLTAMEEYVREAPRFSTVRKKVEEKAFPNVILAIERKKAPLEQESPSPPPPPPESPKAETVPAVSKEPDLLGFYDDNPETSELDAKNALALGIVPVDNPSMAAAPVGLVSENGTTGWELALVTASSSNDISAAASKLAGGLDKLTLDRLYDNAIRRANQQTSYRPWEPAPMAGTMSRQPILSYNPFYTSNIFNASQSFLMAQQQPSFMSQQQQSFILQQQHQQQQQNQQQHHQQQHHQHHHQQQQQQMMLMMCQQQFHPLHPNPWGNPYATANTQHRGFGMPFRSSDSYTGI